MQKSALMKSRHAQSDDQHTTEGFTPPWAPGQVTLHGDLHQAP